MVKLLKVCFFAMFCRRSKYHHKINFLSHGSWHQKSLLDLCYYESISLQKVLLIYSSSRISFIDCVLEWVKLFDMPVTFEIKGFLILITDWTTALRQQLSWKHLFFSVNDKLSLKRSSEKLSNFILQTVI